MIRGTVRPRCPIPLGARVEQITVAEGLHQRGTVIHRGRTGRGYLRLCIRFDGETEAASVRPHLVRVVDS
jgi:hypothetical protein